MFFLSCSSTQHPPLKTVDSVDIERFMGKWYVIASVPTVLEKGAHNAVEVYTWNEKDQRIDVDFTFNQDSFEGKKKHLPQKAFIYNKKTNAEWRIQLIWPLKFPYLVIDLAKDYSYTIISVPDRDYVWIMARTPTMDEGLYQKLITQLKAQHFDTSMLKKVPQRLD